MEVMGFTDNLKFFSSMTLFHLLSPKELVFEQVLNKYYKGKLDNNTIRLCNREGS